MKKYVKKYGFFFMALMALMILSAVPAHAAAKATVTTTKYMPAANTYIGKTVTLKKPNDTNFKWKAINNSYYSVSTAGKLTGKKVGTASFTITCKNKRYIYKITVKDRPRLNYTNRTATVGTKIKLSVVGGDSNTTWSVGNRKIVNATDFDLKGTTFKGAAFNAGTTTITAKTAGFTLTCKVKVEPYNGSLVKRMAPKADSRLISAFDTLKFKLKYDLTLPGGYQGGYFSAKDASITLTNMYLNDDLDDTIYHELGHFLSFVAGNVDTTENFKKIYNDEKSSFSRTWRMSSYATSKPSEYFAESYQKYVLEPSKLKAAAPKTYAAIQDSLRKITSDRISKIKQTYSPIWR